MRISEVASRIQDVDALAEEAMRERLNSLTKPPGSLGRLEELAIRLAGVTGSAEPAVDPAVIILMAADHGVTAEGVSAFPAEVTQQMVRNFIAGGAAVNVLSRLANADVQIVDIGINGDCNLPGLTVRKIRRGTGNMARGPAMSGEDAAAAVEAGMDAARQAVRQGARLLALGEMGIGNTTASSAVLAAFSQVPAEQVAGFGTGITAQAREHKVSVIRRALAVNQPDPLDPIDVLAKVGGLEIAGLAGVVLAAAAARIPVLADGFISSVAALTAVKIAPLAAKYLIGSHESAEPGHRIVNRLLGLRPLLQLDLRLGEGTGAALALPLVRAAARIPGEMATFEQAQVAGSLDGSVKGATGAAP